MPKYIPIIGMEIHAELKTKSKMFCTCENNPERVSPNKNICEICLAHPGTLPLPNKEAIIWTVKIATALGCSINKLSKFDRKHYFYPDLPKGYQISQYDQPIGEHGQIKIELVNTKNNKTESQIGVCRVHLEEDTAKLTHGSFNDTLIDFNRAGVPLVEIVSDPDVKTGTEAKAYCQEIQSILRTLKASDANMEKGQMRCEANISIQEEGKFYIENGVVRTKENHILNNKIELKNINSFKAIEKAINFEIERQTKLLEKGEKGWSMETRGWNDNKGETVLQRIKETAADYRYFPEPDIPPFNPVKIAENFSLPELPHTKRLRFQNEYGFSRADAVLLANDTHWANYAEHVYSELIDWLHNIPETKEKIDKTLIIKKQEIAKLAGGWLTSKLMGAMAERKIHIRILKLKPENFAELIALFYANKINSTNAQKILNEMLDSGTDVDPTHIMEEKGYGQVSDEKKLGKVIEEIISSYPKQVDEFKKGKEPILQFLKGMVMKATEGSADPQIAEKILREKLK